MNGATEASLRKALPKGRLSDLGRLIVAARFDQERAAVKSWLKDVAPRSCGKWFGHDAAKWKQFQVCYRKELGERRPRSIEQNAKAHPHLDVRTQ